MDTMDLVGKLLTKEYGFKFLSVSFDPETEVYEVAFTRDDQEIYVSDHINGWQIEVGFGFPGSPFFLIDKSHVEVSGAHKDAIFIMLLHTRIRYIMKKAGLTLTDSLV